MLKIKKFPFFSSQHYMKAEKRKSHLEKNGNFVSNAVQRFKPGDEASQPPDEASPILRGSIRNLYKICFGFFVANIVLLYSNLNCFFFKSQYHFFCTNPLGSQSLQVSKFLYFCCCCWCWPICSQCHTVIAGKECYRWNWPNLIFKFFFF